MFTVHMFHDAVWMLTGQSLKLNEYVFNLGAFTCEPCGGHVVVSRRVNDRARAPYGHIWVTPVPALSKVCSGTTVSGAALNSDSLTNQDSRTDPAQTTHKATGRKEEWLQTNAHMKMSYKNIILESLIL